ncbi:MAG: hypothetical protein M1568_04395 [Acidobacteria bacterium]|jgi:hypothetical protein|nr:hypothetical protein [Acidobacteriota bacterium]
MLHAMNTLSMACMVEPILWFLALFSYSHFSSKMHFFSFRLYLAAQLAVSALSVPVLFLFLSSHGPAANRLMVLYTQIFWSGSVLAGMIALAVLRGILKRFLASLVGLQRVALVTFQWLLVVAFFVILDRMLADSGHATLENELAILSYGISLTQLVLLALLMPFTFIVRRSLRSHLQDLMMGLAMLATSNSVLGIFFHAEGALGSGAAAVTGHVVLVTTLIFWICCFVTEEKAEHPRMLPIDSKLVRWSEKLRLLDRSSAPAERGR